MKNKTIAEFVAENYKTSDVFYTYGIDFCCGGKKTLSEVCKDKNIDETLLLKDLEAISHTAEDANMASMSPLDLISHIKTVHHEYIRTHTPIILQYLEKIYRVHGSRHPELQKVYEEFMQLSSEMEMHLYKEENILFPYIISLYKEDGESTKSMPFSTVRQPIAMMEHEHDDAGATLHNISNITNNLTPPSDACNTYKIAFEKLKDYEKDLHKHVHLENNILFPNAIAKERNIIIT